MDLACGFQQPGVPGYGTGLSYRISSSRIRYGGCQLGFLGDAKVSYKSCSLKRREKLFLLSKYKRTISRASGSLRCHPNDSLAFVDGSAQNVEASENAPNGTTEIGGDSDGEVTGPIAEEKDKDASRMEDLRELLQKARKELEVARLNSTMFEEKAQRISESAFALKDEAERAWSNVTSALSSIQEFIGEEDIAKEAVQKATMALSMSEARLQLEIEASNSRKECSHLVGSSLGNDEDEELLSAREEIKQCKASLENFETELRKVQNKKAELQKEVDRLSEVAEKVQLDALKAEEDVANIMLLAEQAVAFELEATQHVNDAELALQKAEKTIVSADAADQQVASSQELLTNEETHVAEEVDIGAGNESTLGKDGEQLAGDNFLVSDVVGQTTEENKLSDDIHDQENGKLIADKEDEVLVGKSKNLFQPKKQDIQKKDLTKDSSLNAPKALLNRSSRFFSASFFSFKVEGSAFTPASLFHGLVSSARKEAPKLVLGVLLLGMGAMFLNNRAEKNPQLLQQSDIIPSIEEVASTARPIVREIRRLPRRLKKLMAMLPHQEIKEEEASLFDMLWLLLASVIFVPLFQKIPGGSPVLGYLAAGILIGPYGLSIIRHVHGTKAIAEFGVVFLLFNIGLELSVERLSSMKKYVFGLGSAQVLATAVVIGLVAHFFSGLPGPAAIVVGNGLALSSTAVVLQVLQERGESTSRHGRATFSVLLFQDLAVVVLLILIPLISPNSSKGGVGFQAIAEALGLAAIKAMVAITAIIAGGRLFLRPIYKQIAENQNAEIFSANTLLVILGTSLLTARSGLSMALGAFLAGLLLAETEFSLQVESDIAPYRGLLLGLFFMTVGMSIDPKLLLSNFPVIMSSLSLLIGGKAILVALVGKIFGISTIAAIRVGLLLAPGGEFAFVAFGEAVNQGILSPQLSSLLFLVVGISMAVTPWLAAGGQLLASRFEQHDVRSLLPVESETDDLQDHIIICGFGRVGQIIAQLLSERLIPFVALDVRSDRVSVGRALDLPVYFGDAGSREILHKVGAERACAAAITLDTPGANYRTVWALSKYFPNVKTFVRAHDVDHGINLEKAGATAVVPETLEPSLQLAAAVLAQAKLPTSEIAATINEFRSRHLGELTELCQTSGSSLGYGYPNVVSKPKAPLSDSDEQDIVEGTLAI
ncbi:K(+) efflux antiporter 2, chloroplastic-like [Iris pallida]|uniref:K(+) efflux antiporter 2, chloroplastic-like n=1 Tax=Iris pallida TaxID=29817 RepID=A0AAX6EAQ7_IRIPA|nr:K(+) efflux antiporter 2, chloroplastic-like [Iris pallida]